MSIIVIARMSKDSKVYMAYDINTGKSDMVRASQLCIKYDCLNFKGCRGKVEYIQGKSESRIPLVADLNTGHFCYILYKIKDEKEVSLGYRVLNIDKGSMEVSDLSIRDTVQLIESSICVNAKVVREGKKVFVSAFKNKFEIVYVDTRHRKSNDISHIISDTQKKYEEAYSKSKSLSEEDLKNTYNKVVNPKPEEKEKVEFITSRLKKKSRLSKQIRIAMASCLAVAIIGSTAVVGTGYIKPMLNKQEVTVEVKGRVPEDTESTRIRILNAKEVSTTFNGDEGQIYVDGLAVANIESTLNHGLDDVKITDLNGNIIHSSSRESWEKEQSIFSTVREKTQKTLEIDMSLSPLLGKAMSIKAKDGSQIASVKSTNYLNGLRYRIVDKNGHELYKFSGSKLTDKSFYIKKENITSDISMIDAIVIAATYNTHIDDAKYE